MLKISSASKAALKNLFGNYSNYECCPLATSFGLKVAFEDAVNLGEAMVGNTIGYEWRPPKKKLLASLLDEFQVVVLGNAYTTSVETATVLSKRPGGGTQFLGQDPFHRDRITSRPNTPPFYSILHKPVAKSRATPTLYALESDVRDAIQKLYDLESHRILNIEVSDIIRRMADPTYDFTLSFLIRNDRVSLIEEFPEFTEKLAHLIPCDNLYVHPWIAGENNVVLHSNTGSILHARPQGSDLINCVNGGYFMT